MSEDADIPGEKSDASDLPKSPHDALIEALEHVEEMERVVIICEKKALPGEDPESVSMISFDNDLTIAHTLAMLKMFETYILLRSLGYTKGK